MEFSYQYEGEVVTVQIGRRPEGGFRAQIGGQAYPVEVLRASDGQWTLRIGEKRLHVYTASSSTPDGQRRFYVALLDREAHSFELTRPAPGARRRGSAGGSELTAQMPGQVREVLVQAGQRVEAGQPLLILEAMKMEMRVLAPAAGTVTQVHVQTGGSVERGQRLVEFSPSE